MDAYHESADMSGQARMCVNGRRCCIRTRLRVLVGDGACRHAHTCGGLWLVTHLHRSRGEPRKPAAPDNRPQTTRLRCMQWLTVSRGSLVFEVAIGAGMQQSTYIIDDCCWHVAVDLCGFLMRVVPDTHAASCCHAHDSPRTDHMPFNRHQTLAETQVQMQYLQYAKQMPPSRKANAQGTPCQHILVSTHTIRNKRSQ